MSSAKQISQEFSPLVTDLFGAYTSSNSTDLPSIISDLFKALRASHSRFSILTDNHIQKVIDIFQLIGALFNMPLDITNVEKNKETSQFSQTNTTTTLREIFKQLQTLNVHQNVCASKHVGMFGKKVTRDEPISSSYHNEELFTHLHVCAIVSAVVSINENDGTVPFLCALVGLLHDIAKPCCLRVFSSGNIGYPSHGEHGALLIGRLLTPAFVDFISVNSGMTQIDVQNVLTMAISKHMCFYHATNMTDEWTLERLNSARIDSELIRKYLYVLSFGDIFAAFSDRAEYELFVKTRSQYLELTSGDFVLPENKKKFLILVRGRSDSGKTQAIELLATKLNVGSNWQTVSRDLSMCNYIRTKIQDLDPITERPTMDEYAKYHKIYNEQKLGKLVDEYMKTLISTSIDKNTVTFVDTQKTLFVGSNTIFPDNTSVCMVIAVDVSRNFPFADVKKNGLSLSEQLALQGTSSALFPIDNDRMDLFNTQSKYSHPTRHAYIASPHYVFLLAWNIHYNGENSVGLKYFEDRMFNLISQVSINPTIQSTIETDNMNLVQYVNWLYNEVGQNYDAMVERLKIQHYSVGWPSQAKDSKFAKQLLEIKYLEHNRNWNQWGIEARGTTLRLVGNQWVLFKMLLPRGQEMITRAQFDKGIHKTENNDYEEIVVNIFYTTMNPIERLKNDIFVGNPIDLKFTFKVDGSMCVITLYSGESAQFMQEFIEHSNDKFSIAVMHLYQKVSGSNDVLVFQSQGTTIMNSMQDYTTTALFPDANPIDTPTEKINKNAYPFFTNLWNLFKDINVSSHCSHDVQIKSLICETVCADRQESYSKKIHTELAISYEKSDMTVLAMTTIGNGGTTYNVIPHYEISEFLHQNDFKEPAYWHVTSVQQLNAILAAINECIYAKMTDDEFYNVFSPANRFTNYTQIVHKEGGCVWDNKRIYGKVKTDAYYMSHKLHDKNVTFLAELGKIAGNVFPLAKSVYMVERLLTTESLNRINNELCDLIDNYDIDQSSLPFKAKRSITDKKAAPDGRQHKFKIIINNPSSGYITQAFQIFLKNFGVSASEEVDENVSKFAVQYAMQCEIWLSEPKPIPEELRRTLLFYLAK